MSLAILFYFLCTQRVSDINISIIRSLRLCCWIIRACDYAVELSHPSFCSCFAVCWRFGAVCFE